MIPDTRYVEAPDGAYIAYQVTGDGPVDIAWENDFVGNVDVMWETRAFREWFGGITSFARLILHDRRGTGLSSRNVPPPNLETRVADLRLVLDTVGSRRPVLAGMLEGGASNALLAASDPQRVQSLVWLSPTGRSVWSPDYPWGVKPEFVELNAREIDHWGTLEAGRIWAESEALYGHIAPEEEIEDYARLTRHTGTPDVARELTRIWYETDVRSVLPSVNVPALLLDANRTPSDSEEASYIASLMPRAEVVQLPSAPAYSSEVASALLQEVRRFVGVEPPMPELDTILATVLFTDIVGSTERQAELGDRGWKELIERHHAVVRDLLGRYGGLEQDTAGDGFYVRFDGPARAIRCAQDIATAVRPLGIQIRAGVHTGECELADGKCSGLSVSIASRVMSNAGPSEVLVSQTVKDLTAGSGLVFEDAGEHELRGVPDRWRLYRVAD